LQKKILEGTIVVEFCPKCEVLLIPVREKGRTVLVCRNCGFRREVKSGEGYKSTHKVSEEKKTKITVMEETKEISREEREREKELLREYYEVFLETMESEGREEGLD